MRLAGPAQGLATLDPALVRDLATNAVVRQVFRGLMSFDDVLNPVPELAGSLTVDPGGTTYRAVLRAELTFHDGRPIDARAVRASLTRALSPSTAGGNAQALAAPTYLGDIVGAQAMLAGETDELEGVRVLDDWTLEIVLAAPSGTFPMRLASVPASIVDVETTSSSDWWAAANGSGPFTISSFEPDMLQLGSFDAWWAGRPTIASANYALGTSASQPANLFQAGDLDILPDVTPALAALIADPASGTTIGGMIEVPLFAVSYIALGATAPPLDDVHVRRAISLAYPAQDYAANAFDGLVLSAPGLVPEGMLGRSWPAGAGVPDLRAAEREIAMSRYGTGANVPPIVIHAADIEPVEALRDTIEPLLGLRIEAIEVGWSDFLDGLAQRRFSSYALYWGADYPDPESLLWMLFGSDSNDNYIGYRNPAFDEALTAARREIDPSLRAELYADAHRLLIEDGAVIPLYFDVGHTFWRPGIGGVRATPMGMLGLESVHEVADS